MVRGMASEEQAADKLRVYLRELTPEARAMLMAELERGALRGEQMPQQQVLLQALREQMRSESRLPERIGNPARMFFAPVEPFIVDDAPEVAHLGRIPRASIGPIWEWVTSDVAGAEATIYSADVTKFLLAQDAAKADQAARALQDLVARRIDAALSATARDDKERRRFAFRVGTPRGQQDVREFVSILKSRDALAGVAARLPLRIRSFTGDQLDATLSLMEGILARQRDLFVYALVLVMGRLPAPWQLIRPAIKSAQTDAADRIADTAYAGAVTIVFAEIERMVREMVRDLKRGQVVGAAAQLKDIHEAVRGMRAEMDMSAGSPWGRQLGAIRAGIANSIKPELETMPGRVRRVIRIAPGKHLARGATVDATEVSELEGLAGFLATCRACASELALNEITMRVFSELQNCLENGTKSLLDVLRSCSDAERPYRQAQIDAAVRLCAKVFGQEYASLLSRAADVAVNSERKAAKS